MLKKEIIILSNDIVPGMGMPVAAPGLRAYGIADGLRRHGYKVTIVISSHFIKKQRQSWPGIKCGTIDCNIDIVTFNRNLQKYIANRKPVVVILINSNQVDHIQRIEGVFYILDFFAPKMLEMVCQRSDDNYQFNEISQLRRQKLKAINMVDAYIVNGRKKIPYFLGWILQTQKNIKKTPFSVVNMCLPIRKCNKNNNGPIVFSMSGYMHPWQKIGDSLNEIENFLDNDRFKLDILLPVHWGGKGNEIHSDEKKINDIKSHKNVKMNGLMLFSDYLDYLSTVDVLIDLSEYNIEREYAMVTRAIVALSCGVPVIHPPFTEVSELIKEFDAGWLVESGDTKLFRSIIESILRNPDIVRKKSENAFKLAENIIDSYKATEPLVSIIEKFDA